MIFYGKKPNQFDEIEFKTETICASTYCHKFYDKRFLKDLDGGENGCLYKLIFETEKAKYRHHKIFKSLGFICQPLFDSTDITRTETRTEVTDIYANTSFGGEIKVGRIETDYDETVPDVAFSLCGYRYFKFFLTLNELNDFLANFTYEYSRRLVKYQKYHSFRRNYKRTFYDNWHSSRIAYSKSDSLITIILRLSFYLSLILFSLIMVMSINKLFPEILSQNIFGDIMIFCVVNTIADSLILPFLFKVDLFVFSFLDTISFDKRQRKAIKIYRNLIHRARDED